ncbi:hypothetical protein LLB_1777 [Legionella longbeachae D-4968]|nr:hypothetical protein LLB_1777 [Legionella longbeachae D-4968]
MHGFLGHASFLASSWGINTGRPVEKYDQSWIKITAVS